MMSESSRYISKIYVGGMTLAFLFLCNISTVSAQAQNDVVLESILLDVTDVTIETSNVADQPKAVTSVSTNMQEYSFTMDVSDAVLVESTETYSIVHKEEEKIAVPEIDFSHSGHDTDRLTAQILFIAGEGRGIGSVGEGIAKNARRRKVAGDFSLREKQKICSIQKIEMYNDPSVASWVALTLATALGRADSSPVERALFDISFCKTETQRVVSSYRPKEIRLSKSGVVISKNPVWNACISGERLDATMIRQNTDTYEHRNGKVRKRIPLTCRDYHRGRVEIWRHPDFSDIELTLDTKGRLVGGVPLGFIAIRDSTEQIVQK